MKTIFSHPNFSSLGDNLVSKNSFALQRGNPNMESFGDGWPKFMVEDVKNKVEHKDVTYIADFSRPEYLFENYAIIRGLIDDYANKVRVIVPYFPVGTMERISKKGEIATASYFADLISHIPQGRQKKTSLHIFDIHALSERFLFDSFKVNAELHTTLSLVHPAPDTIIAFPDDGASKRFSEAFPEHARIICTKVRKGVERFITIKEGDPSGADILLIDDLIQTGGTIREAANLFRREGAKSVKAFAPHGVFPGDAHRDLAQHLDELIVTDSLPINVARAQGVSNMRVISLLPCIEKIILGEDV